MDPEISQNPYMLVFTAQKLHETIVSYIWMGLHKLLRPVDSISSEENQNPMHSDAVFDEKLEYFNKNGP